MADSARHVKKNTVFGIRPETWKLSAAALLVAMVLCGAETTFLGRRDITSQEQYNQLILSGSMIEVFKDVAFPPRVSPIIGDGVGVPTHQFYAPLSHAYAAAVSLLLRDLIDGFSYGSVLILSLAFVFSYKLGRYLTLSDHCAAVAAFLFVTAPYIATERVLNGDFSEYFAICILPMTVYFNLRALSLKNFKKWSLAVLSTSALILSNLVIGLFFLLFYAIFHFMFWVCFIFRYWFIVKSHSGVALLSSGQPQFRHNLRKSVAAFSVLTAAVLLCMWHLGPAAFYGDLTVKQPMLDRAYDAASGRMTPALSVFSITDTSWNFKANQEKAPRYQTGILLFASYIAFLYLCINLRTAWALPFALTAGIILFFIVHPSAISLPPVEYTDISQYSYRFLAFFSIIGASAGAVALRTFFSQTFGFTNMTRSAVAITLIALSLLATAPYLYTRILKDQWVMYAVNAVRITAYPRFIFGANDYLRVPPPDDAGPDVWIDSDTKGVAWEGKPGNWFFRVDLEDYFNESKFPSGDVLLNVLYYPGLQRIEIRVDGKPVEVNLQTYWQKMDSLGNFRSPIPGSFHGLKLSGVAKSGILEVNVRFTGYSWANWISFLSFFILVGTAGFRLFRLKFSRKSFPAEDGRYCHDTSSASLS
jgi:hypothetical protein